MYKQILVALDGSALAEGVLTHAEWLAEKSGAKVRLLRAVTSLERIVAESSQFVAPSGVMMPELDAVELVAAERAEAESYLARVTARLRARGIEVEVTTPEGPPEQLILDAAREWPSDLILMTTHGRSGLGRLVFGSVAEGVLRNSSCPVLLVRVSEAGE